MREENKPKLVTLLNIFLGSPQTQQCSVQYDNYTEQSLPDSVAPKDFVLQEKEGNESSEIKKRRSLTVSENQFKTGRVNLKSLVALHPYLCLFN